MFLVHGSLDYEDDCVQKDGDVSTRDLYFRGALNFQLEDLFQSIFKNFECYINLVFPLAKTVLIDNRFTQTTVWNQMNLPIFISHSNDRNV